MTDQVLKGRSATQAPKGGFADAVRAMVKHYQETGAYRPEDVRNVVGDPLGGVLLETVPDREAEYRKRG